MKMKMKNKQKVLAALILSVLFLSYSAAFAKAGYTETIIIDNKLDDYYEEAISKTNYTAYFTNNEENIFLFLQFKNNFTLENETLFFKANNSNFVKNITNGINSQLLNVTHTDKVIELEMSRELGKVITIEIVNIQTIELIFMSLFEKPEAPEPPDSIQLDINANDPDGDGIFILNWEVSKNAKSYAIYFSNQSFNTISNATLLTTVNYKTLKYTINEGNGTYYYRVLAMNDEGETLSNEVSVNVEILPPPPPIPGEFEVITNAENPEEDGKFVLNWTDSERAEIYEVYYSKEMIKDLNDPKVSLLAETQETEYILEDEYLPDGTYYFVVVAKNDAGQRMSNYLTISIELQPEGFTNWTLVTFLIVSWILFAMVWAYYKAKDKVYIRAYRQEAVIKENGIEKRKLSTQLTTIGQLEGEPVPNHEKRCYEFRIRENRTLKYINVFSLRTFEEYKANFCLDRHLFLYYLLDVVVFEKELDEKDWYKKELALSKQAIAYRVFCWFYDLSMTGVTLGPLLMLGLFYLMGASNFYQLLAGALFGLFVSALNFILRNYTSLLDGLAKRKVETIKKEYYMAPLESQEEYLDVYRVWAKKQVKRETADGSTREDIVRLKDDPEDHPTIKDPEDIDFITVVGYEELYNMRKDPTITIEDFKQVDVEYRKKKPHEMRNSKRDYLTRNRELVENNFRLKEQNNRLQKVNRDLTEQLHYTEETIDKKIKEMSERIMKMKKKNRNTLKHIFEETYGEIVGKNWEKTLEQVLSRIQEKQHMQYLDLLNSILRKLISLSENGKDSNLNIERMIKNSGINASELLKKAT